MLFLYDAFMTVKRRGFLVCALAEMVAAQNASMRQMAVCTAITDPYLGRRLNERVAYRAFTVTLQAKKADMRAWPLHTLDEVKLVPRHERLAKSGPKRREFGARRRKRKVAARYSGPIPMPMPIT